MYVYIERFYASSTPSQRKGQVKELTLCRAVAAYPRPAVVTSTSIMKQERVV